MDSAAADELGKFRRMIDGVALHELAPIIATTLDEMILVLRRVEPGNYGVEMAAALSAELHKRNQPRPPTGPYAGNA